MKKLVIAFILLVLVFVVYNSFFDEEPKITSFAASCSVDSDSCVSSGSRRCIGDFTYEICGDYDSDSCLEWSAVYNCNADQVCKEGTCIVQVTIPSVPSNLQANPSSNSIRLNWQDNSNNEQGFKIERAVDSILPIKIVTADAIGGYKQIATVAANVNSYIDSGLQESTTYEYRIRSYNSAGSSSYSNTVSIITLSTCTNECSPINANECSGIGYRICGNYDQDSCLEWGTITSCSTEQTCVNGACLTKPKNDQRNCIDGTNHNSCSVRKPKYCNNGVLANNCALCGCNNNGVCSNNGLCLSINYTSSNDPTILIKSPSIKYIPKMNIDINKQFLLDLNSNILSNEDVIIKFSGNKNTFNSELIDCNLNNNLLTCNPRNQGSVILNLVASNSFKNKNFNINLEIVKNENNGIKKNKPIASLGRDVSVPINSYFLLDSYLSYDPNNDLDENSFEWYEKDKLIGTGRSIKLIYPEIGLHEIRLIITDFSGLKDEDGFIVNVVNRNLCKNTNANYFPDDTLCNKKWPSQDGDIIIINSREYSCNLVEVCDESTDYIIEDAINCCSGVDLQDSRKSSSCNFANKYSQGISKKCQALYLIKSLGSESIYMQDYLEAEMCCRGVESLCSSENNLYKAQPLPYTSRDLSNLRCFNSPTDNPPGRWVSDFSIDKNNIALADLPSHVSLNILSTGTCVDYSFSLTTLIRKLNYKQSEILTVEAPNHAYNLVRFPLDKRYTIVDTTGNNDPAIVFGSVPYGYAYCENIKNCYNDNGFILCPSLNEINGCENAKQNFLQETRFKGIRILDDLKEFGNLIIGEIKK